MNRQIAKRAFYTSLPVMAGYIILGIGFGLMLRAVGYGPLWALSMGVFIYAGAMQYVGVGLIADGVSALSAAITTFMVNARHLFYGISMIERYKGTGKYKPYLIFALTDETYSLLCNDSASSEKNSAAYRFLVSLFNQCYWVTGCVSGNLLGEVLPFSSKGVAFSMTALFVASFTEQWLLSRDHVPALTGLLCALFCLVVFGADLFLIPTMVLITLALTLLRGRRRAAE